MYVSTNDCAMMGGCMLWGGPFDRWRTKSDHIACTLSGWTKAVRARTGSVSDS